MTGSVVTYAEKSFYLLLTVSLAIKKRKKEKSLV